MFELYEAHPKNLFKQFSAYAEKAMMNPSECMDYPDKKSHDLAKRACPNWDYSFYMKPFVKQLECSYVLGCNEYVVKPFVVECAQALACVEFFESHAKKNQKASGPVNEFYNDLYSLLDKKGYFGLMLSDLKFWAETYDFELPDVKEVSELFKSEKEKHAKWLKEVSEKRKNNG